MSSNIYKNFESLFGKPSFQRVNPQTAKNSSYEALASKYGNRRKGRSPVEGLKSINDRSGMITGGGPVRSSGGGGGGGAGGKGKQKKQTLSDKMKAAGITDKDLLKAGVNLFDKYQNMVDKQGMSPEQAVQEIIKVANVYGPKLGLTPEDFLRKQLYTYSIEPGDTKEIKFQKYMQFRNLDMEQMTPILNDYSKKAYELPARSQMDPFIEYKEANQEINKVENRLRRNILNEHLSPETSTKKESPLDMLFGEEENVQKLPVFESSPKPNTIRFKDIDEDFNIIEKEYELDPEKYKKLQGQGVIDNQGILKQQREKKVKDSNNNPLDNLLDIKTEEEIKPFELDREYYQLDNNLFGEPQSEFNEQEFQDSIDFKSKNSQNTIDPVYYELENNMFEQKKKEEDLINFNNLIPPFSGGYI